MDEKLTILAESLSPLERKIMPFLQEKDFDKLIEKSGLDNVSVLRALEFLAVKKIIELKIEKKKIVDLGTNGILYRKRGLPERQLIMLVEKKPIDLQTAQKESKLSQNEFRAALGALKKKTLIELKNNKIMLSANKDELNKKSLEEQFIEQLPLDYETLAPEQKFALNSLKERKDIIEISDKQIVEFALTSLGKEFVKEDLSKVKNLLEEITPDMLKSDFWKGKKFRRYDVVSKVPAIYGGKKHFVNQAADYGRRIWSEMGFKEMTGDLIQESFWNFDVLFTAQDHPVRDLQDTFFLEQKGTLPDKRLVNSVKESHEKGVDNSRGWQYKWNEEEAKKLVLRTHTTCLSARTLAELKNIKDKKGKYFAIGSCFRNETIDSGHLFEFNQTEGIVIDKNANFGNLLGYLKAFLNKMGFEKVRFRPHFFPYTEPSVEADVYDEKNEKWVEVLGAGILRPEVVVPLLGEFVPVLAWGMGFDRLIMSNYNIKDIRELYGNDIKKLREIEVWRK